jgi:hypothetical protein
MSITQTRYTRSDVFRAASDTAKVADDLGEFDVRDALQALKARADVLLAVRKGTAESFQDQLNDERDIGIVIGLIMHKYQVDNTRAAHILNTLATEADINDGDMARQIVAEHTRPAPSSQVGQPATKRETTQSGRAGSRPNEWRANPK